MSPPEVWGPAVWTALNHIVFNYPNNPTPEEKKAAIALFHSLKHMIPCPACRVHYSIGFDQKPVEDYCNSKADLSRWLVDFHNAVNIRLGKSLIEYEDVCKLYLGKDIKSASTEDVKQCAIETKKMDEDLNLPKPGDSYYPMNIPVPEVALKFKTNRTGEFLVKSDALLAQNVEPKKLAEDSYAVCPAEGHGNTAEAASAGFDELERRKEKYFMKKGEKRTLTITLSVLLPIIILLVLAILWIRHKK